MQWDAAAMAPLRKQNLLRLNGVYNYSLPTARWHLCWYFHDTKLTALFLLEPFQFFLPLALFRSFKQVFTTRLSSLIFLTICICYTWCSMYVWIKWWYMICHVYLISPVLHNACNLYFLLQRSDNWQIDWLQWPKGRLLYCVKHKHYVIIFRATMEMKT